MRGAGACRACAVPLRALLLGLAGRLAEGIALRAVSAQAPPDTQPPILLEPPPPPDKPPSPLDALKAAQAARAGIDVPDAAGNPMLHTVLRESGAAPLIPGGLADKAAALAWAHLGRVGALPGNPPMPAPTWPLRAPPPAPAPTPAPPAAAPRLGPPPPPPCAPAPRELEEADVRIGLAPFRPNGAAPGSSQPLPDKGVIWPLKDGGWAFQYPDMMARLGKNGHVQIAWADPRYSVQMDDNGISYHSKDQVVHRLTTGVVVYHQPSGTMHWSGSEVIYHWCNPNVIIYQTPSGIVYYDDEGLTYRGPQDLVHYASNGEVVYQGVGGITRQLPDGSVTHWTEAGALYRHADGIVTYTAVGETQSQALAPGLLPPEPFPGPPLTAEQVLEMVGGALAAKKVNASVAQYLPDYFATGLQATPPPRPPLSPAGLRAAGAGGGPSPAPAPR